MFSKYFEASVNSHLFVLARELDCYIISKVSIRGNYRQVSRAKSVCNFDMIVIKIKKYIGIFLINVLNFNTYF